MSAFSKSPHDAARAGGWTAAHQAFRAQARRRPEGVALSWREGDVTYAALDRRSDAFARAVRARGAGPETRVALFMGRTADAVAALLGILKAGAAYVPVDPSFPPERVAYLLRDCGARLVVTDAAHAAALAPVHADVIVAEDDVAEGGAADGGAPEPGAAPHPASLAYVIYTSGSTGLPKGVAVPHGALAAFLDAFSRMPGMGEDDVSLAVAPLSFDMSVVDLLLPLVVGGRSVLVDRAETLDGAALAARARSAGATVILATPTAWRMLAAAGAEALPPVRAYLGGEAVTPELARALAADFPRVWNLYGPTETTGCATGHPVAADEAPVPVGRPLPNARTYVLDAALRPVGRGETGEICIGGAGVARGYLDRPALTAERFVPDPFGGVPGARMYRSGDLGRQREDGALQFLGRADDQLKVRGYRIEPGEVEAALESHPAVRAAAVVASADERLTAYVAAPGADAASLRRHLRARLPEYMVPARFRAVDALPRTAHGKVDRAALPADAPDLPAGDGAAAPPRTATEAGVVAAWDAVLRPARPVGVDDDFLDLGGHSLLAMQVMARIHAELGAALPVGALLEARTPAALAARVDAALAEQGPAFGAAVRPRSGDGPAPLSHGQAGLWFLHRLDPESAFYNVPVALRLRGALDEDALRGALAALVRRHEALRTTLREGPGGPVQVVAPPPGDFPLRTVDLRGLAPEDAAAEAARLAREEAATGFDLARGPVFRALLVREPEARALLVLNVHHALADGWSMGIVYRELAALYASGGDAAPLPPAPLQYADFAAWERAHLSGERLAAQLDWWRRALEGAPPVLELPTDRPRPARQSHRGGVHAFTVPAETAAAVATLAREEGATPFMVLLSAYAALLHRLSGSDEVVVGAPVAGRVRPELEGVVGYFANVLPLRADVSGEPSFRGLLRRLRGRALEAFAHQELPFEQMVEALHPEPRLSHHPVFQAAFTLQNVDTTLPVLPGVAVTREPLHAGTSMFDVWLELEETGGTLAGRLEYAADLFDPATGARMAEGFVALLSAAVAEPDRSVDTLPARAPRAAAAARLRFDAGATLHARFAAQAARAPAALAVSCEGGGRSYAELEAESNRLAHHLRALGAGPGARVGLCVARTAALPGAILGILKTGAAYLPLDPAYPLDRLAFMAADAGVALAVTDAASAGRLPPGVRAVCLDGDASAIAAHPAGAPPPAGGPESVAYVIYTSGSTGRPKGVEVTHAHVLRLFAATDAWFGFGAEDVWTLFHSYAFDFSVWELWGALLYGGRVVVVPFLVSRSPESFHDLLVRERVTVLNQTPSAFRQLARVDAQAAARGAEAPLALRVVVFGGEALEPATLREWVARRGVHAPTLVNMYGITETTVHVTYHVLTEEEVRAGRGSPVGVPIPDLSVHLLDGRGAPVPDGAVGEVYVGGAGVANGYLARPALTAERFVPDAWSDVPGGRLYRSGDLARRRDDGALEFAGRADAQVKVRGFRIEPAEIAAVLEEHPGVADAVVVVRDAGEDDRRLVAYVVPARTAAEDGAAPGGNGTGGDGTGEQVAQWEAVFDDLYRGSAAEAEAADDFDIVGWNSVYGGGPIPAADMRVWVERTVERILSLRPRRVLELGVGTGLLLFRVAPHAESYLGTDFSAEGLELLGRRIARRAGLPPVTLLQRDAADFRGVAAGAFDTAVLNSVAQYFPEHRYLARVLENAAGALAGGGALFVGDVRNLRTLPAHRAGIELAAADDDLPLNDFRAVVRRSVHDDEELVLDPDFFRALCCQVPRFARAEARLKRGARHIELIRHRYDVVLHTTGAPRPPAPATEWRESEASLEALAERVAGARAPFAVVGIPDLRAAREMRLHALLAAEDAPATAGALRRALDETPDAGVDPEAVWALEGTGEVRVELRPGAPGRFDALFLPAGAPEAGFPEAPADAPLHAYANDPLWARTARALVPAVREHARARLPDYMVPSAVVALDGIPLTENGKLDRAALPPPEPPRAAAAGGGTPPRTETEQAMAALWTEVLRLESVWVEADFFDLGGHSLLATQLVGRVRDAFGVSLPLARVFEARTLEAISAEVDAEQAEALAALMEGLEDLSDDEVRALLEAESAGHAAEGGGLRP